MLVSGPDDYIEVHFSGTLLHIQSFSHDILYSLLYTVCTNTNLNCSKICFSCQSSDRLNLKRYCAIFEQVLRLN